MRVLRFLSGNRYARAYLLVVAAVAVLVALVLWIARTPILPASDLLEGLRRAGEPLLTGWPRQGRRANPSLGQHDSVAAADGYVNVVHKLGPEAWDGDLPAGRECVPDVRVEISQRPDRWASQGR